MGTKELSTVGVEKLTGKDYMTMPYLELQSHPDYSKHAMKVVMAIQKMTTDELEQLTIARGPHNG